jgi:hypothetical protein
MRSAGGRSWSFAGEAFGQLPHAVLYIRDALGLEIASAGAVPPPLEAEIPDRRTELSADRDAAAEEWVRWWEVVVAFERQLRLLGRYHPTPERTRALIERYHEQANPSSSDVLSDSVLQPIAGALFSEACHWAGSFSAGHSSGETRIEHQLLRDTVEAVAADRQVSVGSLSGGASILSVVGTWWHLAEPGFALCSSAAAKEQQTADAVLRAVFGSAPTD